MSETVYTQKSIQCAVTRLNTHAANAFVLLRHASDRRLAKNGIMVVQGDVEAEHSAKY